MEVSSAATENVREKRTSHDVDLARGKRCRKIERERTAPLWLPAARSGSHGGRSPPQSASLPFKNRTLGFKALAIFRCRLKLRLLISISTALARNGHVPP